MQAREDKHLTMENSQELAALSKSVMQHFDRNRLARANIDRTEYTTKSTDSDFFDDLKVSEFFLRNRQVKPFTARERTIGAKQNNMMARFLIRTIKTKLSLVI